MKLFPLFLLFAVLLLVPVAPRIIQSEELINEVFLLERQDRLLAFSSLRNNWFEKELRTGEAVVKSMYDGNVAIAYTTDRALAFSGITGRWAEEGFRIRESVTSINAEGNVGTVITNIRALGFSAKTGIWVESQFKIGQ
ncbi:MAG: hypothetical protein AMK70_00180 [Nitrospira bacterium SG8_35_1]|nr:MAG: hypothetical protein AMK70_00180 [Nitrospira bacterium SG8_35_1]